MSSKESIWSRLGIGKTKKVDEPVKEAPVAPPSFDYSGYPQEVRLSFEVETDEVVVARVVAYLNGKETPHTIEVVHKDEGSMVFMRYTGHSVGINWADPNKAPRDYSGYARSYYGPIGPEDIQSRRAKLLSQQLGISLSTEDKRVANS